MIAAFVVHFLLNRCHWKVHGEGSALILASTPEAARKAAELESRDGERWTAKGAFVPMAGRLPGRMILLNVSDPRDTLPGLVASLPVLVPAI